MRRPRLPGVPDAPSPDKIGVVCDGRPSWQVGERRYLSEGSMALLIKPPASSERLAVPALLKA
jgi:hypothetical protein